MTVAGICQKNFEFFARARSLPVDWSMQCPVLLVPSAKSQKDLSPRIANKLSNKAVAAISVVLCVDPCLQSIH